MTPTPDDAVARLRDGARMDQPSFHALYDQTPEAFRAQLIGGVVRLPPRRVTPRHGRTHARAVFWLAMYVDGTPGTDVLDSPTTILGPASEPEPDVVLLVRPDHDGRTTTNADGLLVGPPELVVEVVESPGAPEIGRKKHDYRSAGVREYVVALAQEKSVLWFRAGTSGYVEHGPDADGVFRSDAFPGLWLDPRALFSMRPRDLTDPGRAGIASPEHAAFVAALAARRAAKPASKKPRKSK